MDFATYTWRKQNLIYKTCSNCGDKKPLECFGRLGGRQCKTCERIKSQKYNKKRYNANTSKKLLKELQLKQQN
jgi:hypothetical protein